MRIALNNKVVEAHTVHKPHMSRLLFISGTTLYEIELSSFDEAIQMYNTVIEKGYIDLSKNKIIVEDPTHADSIYKYKDGKRIICK